MAPESLLSALESLRETYAQRQKAANSLLASLKGTTSAVSKSARALRDYADLHPDLRFPGLDQAQQTLSQLRLKDQLVDPLTPELRRQAKQLAGLTTGLKDALGALRNQPVDVIKLGHGLSAIQAAKASDAQLTALLPQLEDELKLAQRQLGDTFGVALRQAFSALGLELGGRPPRFELGRFEIVADFVNRAAAISYGKHVVAKRVPLSVEAVVKAYQREAQAITGRNEDGARWLEMLHAAWEQARRKRDAADQRANLVDTYYEFVLLRQAKAFRSTPTKSAFVEYSRAQFAYDFFEFADQQRQDYRGLRVHAHTATKSQAENADKSLWIVEGRSPHDGRYVADLVFSREER